MNREGYAVRFATESDAPLIAYHRRAMFRDMGEKDEGRLADLEAQAVPWTAKKIATGDYIGLFAVTQNDAVVAGVGIWLVEWQPSLLSSGQRAMFLNVYTEPAHRRKGLARRLMRAGLEWSQQRGIQVAFLHATSDGKTLYESLGFAPTNEMRLILTKTR